MTRQPWLEEIPSTDDILEEGIAKLNESIDFETEIKKGHLRPSKGAIKLEKTCHEIYLDYERKIRKEYSDVDPATLEQSLAQSRMARGGYTTEAIIHRLLRILDIPCERRVVFPKNLHPEGERLDIVVPDREVLAKDSSKAIIISVKRNVRERWREVVGEAYVLRKVHCVPDNIWFATITCDVSEYIVKSMTQLKLRVYVPDECHKDFGKYNARPLSQMFDDLVSFLESSEKKTA